MNIYWEENDRTDGSHLDLKNLTESNVIYPKPHKIVGGYDITGNGGGLWSVMFMMSKKPKRFHRFCSRLFLGWVWVDEKK